MHEVKPVSMLAGLLQNLQARHDLDTAKVDDVLIGCTAPIGEQGGDIAKTAVIVADWDTSVTGAQLHRYCASGLDAVNLAAMKVASGWEELVVAGGVESLSRVGMAVDGGALTDDPETSFHMSFVPQGVGADLIATMEGFSRADIDAFALRSQQKAAHAQASGYFDKSVVQVRDNNGLLIAEHDSYLKPNTSLEKLATLKPTFSALGASGFNDMLLAKYPQVERINHVHTAGSSSSIVDGASAVLVGSEQMGKDLGLTPRARIVSAALTGTEPSIMLVGPAPATRKALAKAGLTVEDIDLFEVNEAFASVVMRFMKDMDVPEEKVNVNGGAIALGHPLGATGGVLVGTLIDELERRGLRRGVVTLCAGSGIGIATVIELV